MPALALLVPHLLAVLMTHLHQPQRLVVAIPILPPPPSIPLLDLSFLVMVEQEQDQGHSVLVLKINLVEHLADVPHSP